MVDKKEIIESIKKSDGKVHAINLLRASIDGYDVYMRKIDNMFKHYDSDEQLSDDAKEFFTYMFDNFTYSGIRPYIKMFKESCAIELKDAKEVLKELEND